MYNDQSSVISDVHFDKRHFYSKKNHKHQEFAQNKWNKEDNKLLANITNILDANNPIFKHNTIFSKVLRLIFILKSHVTCYLFQIS